MSVGLRCVVSTIRSLRSLLDHLVPRSLLDHLVSRCSTTYWLHQPVLIGVRRGGGAGGDVELAEDVGEVTGDGLLAEGEVCRDLRVAAAGGDEAEYLDLAGGEAGGEARR